MSEVTIKFSFPEETNQFETCINGAKYISVIQDIDDFLRSKVKFAPDGASKDKISAYTEVRKTLIDLMRDENLSIWD